jgi:hypothetical protein
METESDNSFIRGISKISDNQGEFRTFSGLAPGDFFVPNDNKELREANLRLSERLRELERRVLIQNQAVSVSMSLN